MRAKLLSTAAVLLTLSCPAIGAAQTQTQASGEQQMQGRQQQQMQQIQRQLQQAEQALQQQDEQGAEQALDRAAQSIQQMMQQAQDHQQQTLDQVQRQIQQAQQALERQDQQGAQEAVAHAQLSSEQQMLEQQTAEANAAAGPADGSETTAAQTEVLGRTEREQATVEQESATEGQAAVTAERQQPLDTEEIIGQTALTPEGEDLGEIGDLVMSQEGEIEAAVIDVGGFLGIGERQVAVDWNKVEMSPETDQIVVNMTREELEAAPEYQAPEGAAQ